MLDSEYNNNMLNKGLAHTKQRRGYESEKKLKNDNHQRKFSLSLGLNTT